MKAGILIVLLIAIGTALSVGGVFSPPARNLLITQATASAMAGGASAAVLTIENQGDPDQLIDVSSALADARFHNADRGLPIPTGTSALALDAAHIMIAPTEAPFEDGALLPLTLRFEGAGEVSVKARFSVPDPDSMAAHIAMGHGSRQHEVTEGPKPSVSLAVEKTDSGWLAWISAQNFTFAEELQDGDHVPGTGHGHIYLGDMKLGRVFADSYPIGALPAGQHVLRLTLNTNDHRAYAVDGQPVAAETIIEVD